MIEASPMSPGPFPVHRIYLSHTISEPSFGATPDELFYVRLADGRRSIVRQFLSSGLAQSVTTEPMPKGGVGYGGAIYSVHENTLVYAAKDGKLYRIDLTTGDQKPITAAYEGVAAPEISPCGRFVAFLAEQDGKCNVLLSGIHPGEDSGPVGTITISTDLWYCFNPAFSPDGTRLAWLEWNEMDMPWDESIIRIARFAEPTPQCQTLADMLPFSTHTIAEDRVSHGSPQFSPDGSHLAYTSDASGWRSLWIADPDGGDARIVPTGDGEIGRADWVPGLIGVRWSPEGDSLYAARRHRARDTLLEIRHPAGTFREIETPWTVLDAIGVGSKQLVLVGSAATEAPSLITIDRATVESTIRATSSVGLVNRAALHTPEILSWNRSNATVWGLLYRGVTKKKDAPGPLMVYIHGGPTSESPLGWDPQAQYFATRGWHYLVVNHRGSTGYGRQYQDMLQGQWGVADVTDACDGANHLIDLGAADPDRIVITGGSSGGYTTLMALSQKPEFWAAGVALYGIGGLYDLMLGSHRFEIHYEQSLIGRLPEAGALWKARSPLTHVQDVRAPVLLFHGREDVVVPHQQSVDFAEAVRRKGGIAELVSYDGEGHGFVKEATRRDVIEKMEGFLNRYVRDRQ